MKSVAAILVVLCLAHLQDVNATVKVLHKSRIHPGKELVFGYGSDVDERLTYAVCDNNPKADEVKCTVIREKKPYEDDSYSCNLTLKREANYDKEHMPWISIFSFGKHYAALNLGETGGEEERYIKFITVQLDSCKVGEATIHTQIPLLLFDLANLIVVGHSDSYDVFYSSVQVSWVGKTYKATINAGGQLVNESSPSIGTVAHRGYVLQPIVSLDDDSSSKGYFYIKLDEGDFIYSLIKPDGTEKSLARYQLPSGIISVSRKNNLIGVCYQTDSEYNCSQYDFDGNVKLQATVPRDYKGDLHLLDVYNLPNGGFYMFSGKSDKEIGFIQFLIERLDANGKTTGSVNFQGFDSTFEYNKATPLFYENEAKDTCVSLVTADIDRGRLELTANCFTDADFSQ